MPGVLSNIKKSLAGDKTAKQPEQQEDRAVQEETKHQSIKTSSQQINKSTNQQGQERPVPAQPTGHETPKEEAPETKSEGREKLAGQTDARAIGPQKRAGIDILTRLTQRSNKAMMAGVEKAKELQNEYIDTEHVLWGLLSDSGVFQIISELKVTPAEIQKDAEAVFKKGSFVGNPHFSPRVKKTLELSLSAARGLGYEFVSPEHILLALAQEGEGQAAKILAKHGLTVETLNEYITGKEKTSAKKEGKEQPSKSTLEQFAHDLTRAAKEGKLDPVVARSGEIERVMHIISRRTKNNPVLIGDAGVGKTAIVEGLAQRIAAKNVPETLQNKRVLSIDLMSLIAGASHRGEFEERLKNLLREVKSAGGEIILFIDEIHNMVGAGGSGGSMDASNILKPSLARGELQAIGATTVEEYRKYMEKDRALERRFQPVLVEEPSPEKAVQMVTALRDKYEAFHKVSIPDDAIKSAVYLSNRYIGDRFLPDKAIDLIDEAASSVRLPAISLPEDISSLKEQLKVLNAEREEAVKGKDDVRVSSIDRKAEKIQKELEEKQKAYELKKATTTNQVTPEIIQEIVSRWTGIPLSRLTESESQKLLNLEDLLHEKLIDQEHAVDAVAEAVRRGRAGLKSSKRPIGSFVFMGPTGVGKTQLAKALAEILFGSEEKMVRLDMSEYMEKHEVAKLTGAPPGYVGYEEGGQLTEAVRRQPYSVVLLDEVEKAHADVFNILLQILDDGRLTDNKGRTIDFKNTIIIATSNIGTNLIQKEMLVGKKFELIKKAVSTLVYSPTGRVILTSGKRGWQKDKEAKSWTTFKLKDYFKGQTVEGADILSDKQKFPIGKFDAHTIAPSGEETITSGKRVWRRKSTTAKTWKTLSLIDYFKNQQVSNAAPDKPDQQLPTAKLDTSAVSPTEIQIVTYKNRYWMRASLASDKWETGTLEQYLEGSSVGKSGDLEIGRSGKKTSISPASRSPHNQNPIPDKPENQTTSTVSPRMAAAMGGGGAAEPDPALDEKMKDLIGNQGSRKSGDQGSMGEEDQGIRGPGEQGGGRIDNTASASDVPDKTEVQTDRSADTADSDDTSDEQTGRKTDKLKLSEDSKNKLPTDSWDVHLFTHEGEEIIIKGKDYWKRDAFTDKVWEHGKIADLFKQTKVENAKEEETEKQLPFVEQKEKEENRQEEEKFAVLKAKLLDELRSFFRPELLNRFDDLLVFRPLSGQDLLKIVDLQLDDVAKLMEEQNIGLETTDEAKQELVVEGYDPLFGARPLRRTIQRMVENPISSMIIKGEVKSGDIVNVDFDGKDFVFTAKIHPKRVIQADDKQTQADDDSQAQIDDGGEDKRDTKPPETSAEPEAPASHEPPAPPAPQSTESETKPANGQKPVQPQQPQTPDATEPPAPAPETPKQPQASDTSEPLAPPIGQQDKSNSAPPADRQTPKTNTPQTPWS